MTISFQTLTDGDFTTEGGLKKFFWSFSVSSALGMRLTAATELKLLDSIPGDEGYIRVTHNGQPLTAINFSIEDCSTDASPTVLYHVVIDDLGNIHTRKLSTRFTPKIQGSDFKIEAEEMALQNFSVVTNQSFASGTKFITGTQAVDGAALAIATYTFDKTPGDYRVTVKYFDENDGVSVASLYKNDELMMAWPWIEATPSSSAGANTARQRQSAAYAFSAGDILKYTVTRQAGENGRTDCFEFKAV